MPFVTKYAWNIIFPAIDKADIIIQVLDARNPQGTRSKRIEEKVAANDKKMLIFVLNKTDYIPRRVEAGWLNYLSSIAPTIPISAKYPNDIREFLGKLTHVIKQHPRWIGVDLKMKILVLGYPNSGKSTLIQAMTENRKKVRSSSQAGFTRGIQLIAFSDKIYLIDSPGVIPPDKDDEIHQALDTCSIAPQKIEDKESIVDEIFRRVGLETLNKIYELNCSDQFDLIEGLGKKRGYLAKGGRVREEEVLKLIITDWQRNRIPFYYMFDPRAPSTRGTPCVGRIKKKRK
ncbi:MAG: GTPase [Promethearchaeota archaeon]